jgi:hypothetical protein
MKYTDVVSLRAYSATSADPRYAPGVQRDLYFHVQITGSITHQIAVHPPGYFYFDANSTVTLLMNGEERTSINADTTSAYGNLYPASTRWSPFGNWDSLTVDGSGNFVGSVTLFAGYDSSAKGYAYELEEILEANANLATAYISEPNSAHLVGITYADGTTPESHGYQIVDATGFPSPNVPLTAVPEPSTLGLAVLGVVGLAFTGLPYRPRRVAG